MFAFSQDETSSVQPRKSGLIVDPAGRTWSRNDRSTTRRRSPFLAAVFHCATKSNCCRCRALIVSELLGERLPFRGSESVFDTRNWNLQ